MIQVSMYRYSQGRRERKAIFSLAGLKQRLKNLKKGSIIKNLILLCLAVGLGGALLLLSLFAWYSQGLPDPGTILNREVAQSTKIYDRTGTHLLYEIAPDQKRTLVTIEQIPLSVQQATITAEDRNFYEHDGISIKGIIRSVLSNVISLDPTGQGASTITQQFIKKAFLTDDQTYSRKIKEIMIALALEKKFEKNEILQLYLNEIPYGGTNYGIESAAQAYFKKPVTDVSLAEAATLAALPNRPSTFLNNPELLKARRDWILNGMVEEGYVSREEADVALAQETPVVVSLRNIEAPHFVLWVKEQLEEKYGARTTETGGLKVITTLDYDKQLIAEEAVTNGVTAKSATYAFDDAGLVALDPKTGQILSMVGSPDYWNDEADGQVNVTLRPLQPGSSIKPMVYAAAFERGYTPNTIVWDVKTTFPTTTGNYSPNNYDGGEHGFVTLRKALQGSLNIPAVKTLYLAGIENALNLGKRLGYTTLEDEYVGLSMVLGGVRVTPLEHAAAFATFANNGVRHDTVAILSVQSPDGTMLEEWRAEEHTGTQATDKNIAAMLSNVLSDNVARSYIFGANNYLTLSGRPAASKTGTTNEYKDAWTAGYTPSLVSVVWVGNADGTLMKTRADGSVVAAPIWKEYMDRSLKGTPAEAFPIPAIPMTGKDILDGKMPSTTVVIDSASGKLATELTPERFRVEKVCGDYHNILTYINREDPLGAAPKDPAKADVMYGPWESGVVAYLAQTGEDGQPKLEACEVPTESDDVHTQRNKPDINFDQPNSNESVGRSFTTSLDIDTRRAFNRVDYSVDGAYILTSFSASGASITLPAWVSSGQHTLTATVYDDVDNSAQDSVQINVTETGSQGSFRITNPFQNQTIIKTGANYDIAIEVPNASDLSSLKITAQNLWTGETLLVGETSSPSAITTISWNLPAVAQYALTATATSKTGSTDPLASPPVVVFVKDASPVNTITLLSNDDIPLVTAE
ncbi:MAG: PBP1A family penicillin-binding protein [Patescibacteria group bacterium]